MDRLQMAVARAKEKQREAGFEKYVAPEDHSDEDLAGVFHKIDDDELAARRIVAGMDDVSEGEIFRLLRTKILGQMRENGWKSIAISAPTAGQGKSTVVANLALAISMEITQSVLAVDLDLRRPNLHRVFGIEPKLGLADILKSEAALPEALINVGSNRLTILPGRGIVPNSSEWLSSPTMQQLFSAFKSRDRARYVIYDMPPLLQSDDVLKSVNNFDCLLLVVEDGRNAAEEIRQSLDMLKQTNFIGYVLNKTRGFGLSATTNSEMNQS